MVFCEKLISERCKSKQHVVVAPRRCMLQLEADEALQPPSQAYQFQDAIEANAVVVDIDVGIDHGPSSSTHEKHRGSCTVQRHGPSEQFRQPRRRRSPHSLSHRIQWIRRGRSMHSGGVVLRGHAQLSPNLRRGHALRCHPNGLPERCRLHLPDQCANVPSDDQSKTDGQPNSLAHIGTHQESGDAEPHDQPNFGGQ